jgi:hypothetical protein
MEVVIHYEENFKRLNANNSTPPPALTPHGLTSGTITCDDPRCNRGFPCGADNLCRDRMPDVSERDALIAYLLTL